MARAKKTAPTKIPAKTRAEEICEGVAPDIRDQAVTLANAVLVMQKKIEAEIPNYIEMPLAQHVTVGTGESMLRANPATQEFRATVRDYANALNNLENLLDNKKTATESSPVEDLRQRFGIG